MSVSRKKYKKAIIFQNPIDNTTEMWYNSFVVNKGGIYIEGKGNH